MRSRSPAFDSSVFFALRLPRFPLGQLDAIARQRFVVQVEDARRAAAVAAVFQFRLFGRNRAGIVGGRIGWIGGGRRGHGEDRMTKYVQYKGMPPGLPAASHPSADARCDLARPSRDRHRCVHAGRRYPQHLLRRALSGPVRSGPVTTVVQVERLCHPDLLIEIAAVAEIPLVRFRGRSPHA